MSTIPIYTKSNWSQIQYLWPKGTWDGKLMTIWLNQGSRDLERTLEKLRRVNPYLAEMIGKHVDSGHVVFRKEFKDEVIPKWSRK